MPVKRCPDVAPCTRGAGLLPSRTATMARTTRSTEKAVSAGERSVASAMPYEQPDVARLPAHDCRKGETYPDQGNDCDEKDEVRWRLDAEGTGEEAHEIGKDGA